LGGHFSKEETTAKMYIITEEGGWSPFVLCPTVYFLNGVHEKKNCVEKVKEFYTGGIRQLCINPLKLKQHESTLLSHPPKS
jgi:hypothetical protein